MRRIQILLAGIFLGGVVLGGIGTGIALVEYSSLSYGGEHLIGEENMVTENFDFAFEPEGNMITIDPNYLNGIKVSEIKVDNTVPFGIVRYEVTYNEKLVTPYLRFYENEEALYEESVVSQEQDMEREEAYKESEELLPEEGEPNSEEESQGTDQMSEEKEEVYLGELWLAATYEGSDFGILMQNKDRFLEELKNKTVSDYDVLYITDIRVKVNQETLPSVKLGKNEK